MEVVHAEEDLEKAIQNITDKLGQDCYDEAIWFFSDDAFKRYCNREHVEISQVRALDLHFIAPMRTRSW
jgi:hypothetical protein